MAGVTIASNISSLKTQRRVADVSSQLATSYERLSSGLRINKAGDDSAGLAISEGLKSHTRIFSQAIQNINDGISLFNITQSALESLSTISTRQLELASQSANGTLTVAGRRALNQEANALVQEFNRIVATTKFNGLTLTDQSVTQVGVQVGSGGDGNVIFALGSKLARGIGDGTYGAITSFEAGVNSTSVNAADFNNDGKIDLVTTDWGAAGAGHTVSVYLGNGDGGFRARASYETGGAPFWITSADMNGDGNLDLIDVSDKTNVLLGNGDGTFKARISLNTGTAPLVVATADLNNDGKLDIVTPAQNTNEIDIFLGNGDGTFKANTSLYSSNSPGNVTLADFNGDNYIDIVVGVGGDSRIDLYLGNGNGSFGAPISFRATNPSTELRSGDFNGDGYMDIASSTFTGGSVDIFIGNGNGSFTKPISYGPGSAEDAFTMGDLNGDGYLDFAIANNANKYVTLLGNGDGTFRNGTSAAASGGPYSIATADFNGDGAADLTFASAGSNNVGVVLANALRVSTMPFLNISSQSGAREAMDVVGATMLRINAETGSLGSTQSRLGTALSVVSITRENYASASSRITDVDVAEETTALVTTRILEQASVAVLAQANQQPQLALNLLQGATGRP